MTLITETATGLPVVKHSERVAQAAAVGILQLETGLSACPCGRLLEVVAVMMHNLASDEQHRSPNPVIMVLDIMSHDGRAPFEPRIKTRADRPARTEVTETALGGRFPALLCAAIQPKADVSGWNLFPRCASLFQPRALDFMHMDTTTLREDLKTAMRAKDQLTVDTLRGVLSAFTNELVAKGRKPTDELSTDEMLVVMKRLAKQRKDSIEQFEKGGRPEMAEKEKQELAIIEGYLPQMASEEQIEAAAKEAIAEAGAVDAAAAGKLTGAVMKKLGGNADGGAVRAVLQRLLA